MANVIYGSDDLDDLVTDADFATDTGNEVYVFAGNDTVATSGPYGNARVVAGEGALEDHASGSIVREGTQTAGARRDGVVGVPRCIAKHRERSRVANDGERTRRLFAEHVLPQQTRDRGSHAAVGERAKRGSLE